MPLNFEAVSVPLDALQSRIVTLLIKDDAHLTQAALNPPGPVIKYPTGRLDHFIPARESNTGLNTWTLMCRYIGLQLTTCIQ